MWKHTSLKSGGFARFFAKVNSVEELKSALNFARENNLEWFILGKGTNLLVSGKGYPGIIIQLGQVFSSIQSPEPGCYNIGAATPLARIARLSIQDGFAGIHKLAGIPGSLGGAVFMNAGAYGQEIGNAIVTVSSLDEKGNIIIRKKEDCKFGYRHSIFQNLSSQNSTAKEIILSATIKLQPGNSSILKNEMEEAMAKRRSSQPLNLPNAGSTFRRLEQGSAENPAQIAPGYYIEQAGLKGFSIGDAEVSTLHANFVVNKGNASPEDICALIHHMERTVQEKFGVTLKREIIYLGFFE